MSNTEDTPKQKISILGSKSCKVRWSIFTIDLKNLKNSMHMEIEITWTDFMEYTLFSCTDSDADEA